MEYHLARWRDGHRFLTLDPFFGNLDDPQSLHKHLYSHGDPINGIDPTGLSELISVMSSISIGLTIIAMPTPGDFIQASAEALVSAYAMNLEWDLEWAEDWNLPDDLNSRSDNSWVTAAILSAFYDSYYIGIPFTDFGFNPLDLFSPSSPAPAGFSAAIPASLAPPLGAITSVVSAGVNFAYSQRKLLRTAQGVGHYVKFFIHPKFKGLPIVKFPKSAIKQVVTITPNGGGPVGRTKDIAAANAAKGKLADYDWSDVYGEPYTWHHDTKWGVMQLVPRSLHKLTIPHIGGNALWYM